MRTSEPGGARRTSRTTTSGSRSGTGFRSKSPAGSTSLRRTSNVTSSSSPNTPRLTAPRSGSIQWFIPWVPTVLLGGVYTILRFAAHFAREHGVESRFCIYDVPAESA